jgi:hypothetical protein
MHPRRKDFDLGRVLLCWDHQADTYRQCAGRAMGVQCFVFGLRQQLVF